MVDWPAVIKQICPSGSQTIRKGVADAMPDLATKFGINTPLRQAHFLAQCAHESAGMRTTVEYASGKEYEGRKDLGNVQPGDGVRYKGRGLIQLTGRANYAAYGKKLGMDLVGHPDDAAAFPAAILTAGQYWADHGLNAIADKDDVLTITKRINGGTNGLAERKAYLAKAKAVLK